MKQVYKKVIAREFLFLLGSTILFFATFFIWLYLGKINRDKQEKIQIEINQLKEYENMPYRLKVLLFVKENIDYENRKISSIEFISSLKKDSLFAYNIFSLLKKHDNEITISKQDFFRKIVKDNKSENYLKKISLQENKLRHVQNSFFNNGISNREIEELIIIFVIIFFGIRYLFYATKWSLKQFKSE
ncbi:hypothetical protein [uncultured Kordia sp.]|uniref:hypothetical protein n=1 Tax=uncultured Kordia sp. TaxID=507699 RepID=UPI002633894E|nr:hypothetical protein [uncultured Kordia sp.]